MCGAAILLVDTICIIVTVTAILSCLLVCMLTLLLVFVTASTHACACFSRVGVDVATSLPVDVSDFVEYRKSTRFPTRTDALPLS